MTAPQRMQFFVTEEIGPNRALTPAGFLLCTDVPLARTGFMNYAPGETPVSAGPKGYVEIERNDAEVFSPQSLASYSGAPFTLEHPVDDVIPTNWRDLAHGVVLNARRGDNELKECVVGDILVKSPEGIEAIQGGKREVSVGYTCDYDEIEPGRGRQRNIVVNHVALVERGRCGPRCSIGDEAPTEIPIMTAKTADTGSSIIKRMAARLRAAVATKDEAAIEKELTGLETVTDLVNGASDPAIGSAAPGSTININLGDKDPADPKDPKDAEAGEGKDAKDARDARDKVIDAFMKSTDEKFEKITDALEKLGAKDAEEKKVDDEKILGALQMEAPPGTSDAAIKSSTKDSAILEHSFRETISLAEVLAPGLPPPMFDKAAPASKTFDSICGHRRAALKVASGTPELVKFIGEGVPKGLTIDTMTCDTTRQLFKGAAAVKAAINNGAGKTADVTVGLNGAQKSAITSIADLNKLGREKYGATH